MKTEKHVKTLQLLFILVTSIILFITCFQKFDVIVDQNLTPQIKRAIIQASASLPRLLENEQVLRDTYEEMKESRQQAAEKSGVSLSKDETDIEDVIDRNISWEKNLSGICIGYGGNVRVVKQSDLRVHKTFTPIEISKIPADATEESLDVECSLIMANGDYREEPLRLIKEAVYGCVLSYDDAYIICGIPVLEYISETFVLSGFALVVYLILAWMFFRYTGFYFKKGRGDRKEAMVRFTGLALALPVAMFSLSLYYQRLKNVTYDLKTMSKHAQAAVNTLEQYGTEKQKIDAWLDEQYLLQCRMAAGIVKEKGKAKLSRTDLAKYAKYLGVEHIYVFDKKGRVIVTNAPYDHFVISKDPDDQSYAFRALLDGADHIIQSPMKNEVMGDEMQYIGVSLRDENDLCDGFVQIGVDPSLRQRLTARLDVENVLENLVIGLPEHAIAVDKTDMSIVSTTGIGYAGQKVSDIGISEEDIRDNFSGYLWINGKTYYAGASETKDYYLVPLVSGVTAGGEFSMSVYLFLYTLAAFGILRLISNPRLKKYFVDEKGEEEEDAEEAFTANIVTAASLQNPAAAAAAGNPEVAVASAVAGDPAAAVAPTAANGMMTVLGQDGSARNPAAAGMPGGAGSTGHEKLPKQSAFQGFRDMLAGWFKMPEKKRFDARWNMTRIPVEEQSPEMRLKSILYRILFLFCFLVLVPVLSDRLSGVVETDNFSAIAYVVGGNWQKGINIFAFSSCVFLICGMYVVVVVLNRLLYYIARMSSMRVETICLLTKNVIKYACVIIFAYYGLAQFGVDTKTLLASAGILSLMVGIGAKDLVNDIIAGFFIIFEGSFKVGDWIKVGSWIGMVREIGIRTTKVEFFSDTMIFNNSSLRDVAVTDGQMAYMRANIPIAIDTDIDRLEQILEEELPLIVEKNPLITRARYQGIDRFADSAMEIRIYCFTNAARRGPAMRQFYRDMKVMFDRYGIKIPYTQIVVHEAKQP